VCLGTVGGGGAAHTRYLVKRLRRRFPHLKIVCGRWAEATADAADRQRMADVTGCDAVAATLVEARDALVALAQVAGGRHVAA
jgi:hypothetical protein